MRGERLVRLLWAILVGTVITACYEQRGPSDPSVERARDHEADAAAPATTTPDASAPGEIQI